MTMTYEVTAQDQHGPLRGISHSYEGYQDADGNTVHVYAVESRIADLFEADCEVDALVISYDHIYSDDEISLYIESHDDDDEHDLAEMRRMFRSVHHRNPSEDEERDLWSHVCSLVSHA